jgi:hypothetical protein
VRRQIDSVRPATALRATVAPPPQPRPSADRLVDTGTFPLGTKESAPKPPTKEDESAAPLSLAKTFDSFDATLRLASMTNQTEDFRDYITATAKMRAYRGKIEPGSPLAPKDGAPPEPDSKPPPPPLPKPEVRLPNPELPVRPRPFPTNLPVATMNPDPPSQTLTIIVIAVLALAAVGLAVALYFK